MKKELFDCDVLVDVPSNNIYINEENKDQKYLLFFDDESQMMKQKRFIKFEGKSDEELLEEALQKFPNHKKSKKKFQNDEKIRDALYELPDIEQRIVAQAILICIQHQEHQGFNLRQILNEIQYEMPVDDNNEDLEIVYQDEEDEDIPRLDPTEFEKYLKHKSEEKRIINMNSIASLLFEYKKDFYFDRYKTSINEKEGAKKEDNNGQGKQQKSEEEKKKEIIHIKDILNEAGKNSDFVREICQYIYQYIDTVNHERDRGHIARTVELLCLFLGFSMDVVHKGRGECYIWQGEVDFDALYKAWREVDIVADLYDNNISINFVEIYKKANIPFEIKYVVVKYSGCYQVLKTQKRYREKLTMINQLIEYLAEKQHNENLKQ